MELLEQIKQVADARNKREALKLERDILLAQWETEHAELIANMKAANEQVESEEVVLRELTIKAFNETGEKQPAPGVGIRETTKLEYESKIAFDWAKSHRIALMLDTKAFEKIARADPPDFVKTRTEVIATIATDLNKVLEGK